MKCPKCQCENPEDAKFCNGCGQKLELTCEKCGRVNPPGSRFCNECGHSLTEPEKVLPIDYNQPQSYTPKFLADKILTTRSSIEGERKLVTVLFADVANFTSISEKLDPEEVHQIMDGCFKILMDEIHRYEGTINQFTGDGVMALFGAPIAHEDHAQRACHAALSIQKAMKGYGNRLRSDLGIEFKLRIGLNSGHVVVGSIGDDLRMDYTAVGDTTNLASRMEEMANPDNSLVSASTYALTKDFFEFESLGKVEIKGKGALQDAYRLLKTGEVETRIEAAAVRGLSKFVGRTREMEAIKECFEKALSGSGQVVGVVGEAGVGKSRLLIELRNMLSGGDYAYLEGRCLHYGGSMAYLPILDILRSYFDIKEADREFIIKKKIKEKIFQLDERLKTVLPPFQEILSLKVDDGAYLQLEPGEKKQRRFEAIRDLFVRISETRDLFVRISETQPLVLVVEDLHWIDRISEKFLRYLIDCLPGTHILLILLYRPEYTHPWGSKSYYSKIGVDQLSTESSAKLVAAILEGGKVVPELRELILERAGGNPLFVEELTQSLLENGSIQKKNHSYILSRRASEIEVPDTLQGIIAARIDRVEESLKRIMQVASVIGREFAFRVLETILGMQKELKSQLHNLQGLEFISEKQLFPELEYIFKHAFIQEVAYKSLLQKRRKELHEKIGKAIEEIYPERIEQYYELLAYHFANSDNTDKAVEYLAYANRKAIKLTAMKEAMAYFDDAIRCLDKLPDTYENRRHRISLLVNQHQVFFLLFKYRNFHDLLIQSEYIATELNDPKLLGGLYSAKGFCEWIFGDNNQCIKTCLKAAELGKLAGNDKAVANAYSTLQFGYAWKGYFDKSISLKEKILRRNEKHFSLRSWVHAFCASSFCYLFLGQWDVAVAEGQEALRVAKEYSDNIQISYAATAISYVHSSKWDTDSAIEYAKFGL